MAETRGGRGGRKREEDGGALAATRASRPAREEASGRKGRGREEVAAGTRRKLEEARVAG
jgi:hypothetical protein